MRFIRNGERDVVNAVAGLADCNPFLPERVELERRALRDGFVDAPTVLHAEGATAPLNANAAPLRRLVEQLGTELRERLAAGARATAAELAEYQRIILYLLFHRYEDDWYALMEAADAGTAHPKRVGAYGRFARDVAHFFSLPALRGVADADEPAHFFAIGYQARRAFHLIFRHIFGGSLPAARLRATVWQSIFTFDAARYRAGLYERIGDSPTLITGESGTGKELVARAIALSRYIPFDARSQTFAADASAGFCAVNVSALSPTLVESELFGHRRGAFTGAAEDRAGWLESCDPHGAVFLDEVGEIDPAIQVKLLRVMQTREFQRIGETKPRRFAGKVIAATNRNLWQEIAAGRFREDFYYRLCADVITMPTLRQQLADAPGDLGNLLRIVADRIAGVAEGDRLARQAEAWVLTQLGADYPWPGNMRELEQCVRNIVFRGAYWPPQLGAPGAANQTLTADELLQNYCASVQAQTRSYQETGRLLHLDPRTVRTKVSAWSRRQRNGPHE